MTLNENRIHSVLHANLIPPYQGKLFMAPGRKWLAEQPLAEDERLAVNRCLAALDAMEEELTEAERALAAACLGDDRIRLMTIGGINMPVAAGVVSAIGDVSRFSSAERLVSYLGLGPRVRQSGDKPAQHGRISKEEDYTWGRPALVAMKQRQMQLKAGANSRRGSNAPGPARDYSIKVLRQQERGSRLLHFQPLMRIRYHQLHPAQASTCQALEKARPERLCLRGSDVQTDDLPLAIGVHRNSYHRRHRGALALLQVGRVQPQIRLLAGEWPINERMHPLCRCPCTAWRPATC